MSYCSCEARTENLEKQFEHAKNQIEFLYNKAIQDKEAFDKRITVLENSRFRSCFDEPSPKQPKLESGSDQNEEIERLKSEMKKVMKELKDAQNSMESHFSKSAESSDYIDLFVEFEKRIDGEMKKIVEKSDKSDYCNKLEKRVDELENFVFVVP